MNRIHDFLLAEEGYTTECYVPNNRGVVIGQSGLTIAAGVDIGQISRFQFDRMPMSKATREALQPFVSLRGQMALEKLRSNGHIAIPESDAKALSNYAFDDVISRVRREYGNFDELPIQAQTVLVSLAYNLGVHGSPYTSGKIAAEDYNAAITELRDKSAWRNRELDGRRNREADLLQEFLT